MIILNVIDISNPIQALKHKNSIIRIRAHVVIDEEVNHSLYTELDFESAISTGHAIV